MIRLIALLLTLITSTCFAEWPGDSICRVQSQSLVGISDATGVVVGATDKEMAILTAAHAVLHDGTTRVMWTDDIVQTGKLIGIYREKDLALFSVPLIPGKVPVVSGQTLKENGPFIGKGFAGLGVPTKLSTNKGPFKQFKDERLEFSPANEHGTSGGPVFDKKERMVGLMVSHRLADGVTVAVTGQDIQRFMAAYGQYVAVSKVPKVENNDEELTQLFRRRTFKVPKSQQPAKKPCKDDHKVDVVVQENVVVEEDNNADEDDEPTFNFPVQTDDLDYATEIQNEVNEQTGDGMYSEEDDTPEPTPPQEAPDEDKPPVTVPPPTQPVKEEQKLDEVLAATQSLQQTINNINTTQAVNFQPVLDAITANKTDNTQVVQLLNDIKSQLDKPTVPVVDSKAVQPLVLVTSNFLCNDCPGVVAKARDVRDKKGINIRIVKLDGALSGLTPEQAGKIKLDGVPVMYDFRANRTIVGPEACLEFLNSL